MKMQTENQEKYEESQSRRIRAEFEKYVTSKQSLMIATINENNMPDASYAPFVVDDKFNVFILVSDIVERTRNLIANGKASLLFIEDESSCKHIFARKRVTMQANAKLVQINDSKLQDLQKLFHNKFGEFVNLEIINKSDFHLIEMRPLEASLTKGFGLAYRLTGSKLEQVEHLKKGHTSRENQKDNLNGAA